MIGDVSDSARRPRARLGERTAEHAGEAPLHDREVGDHVVRRPRSGRRTPIASLGRHRIDRRAEMKDLRVAVVEQFSGSWVHRSEMELNGVAGRWNRVVGLIRRCAGGQRVQRVDELAKFRCHLTRFGWNGVARRVRGGDLRLEPAE
jgi:hypothetical protein